MSVQWYGSMYLDDITLALTSFLLWKLLAGTPFASSRAMQYVIIIGVTHTKAFSVPC